MHLPQYLSFLASIYQSFLYISHNLSYINHNSTYVSHDCALSVPVADG